MITAPAVGRGNERQHSIGASHETLADTLAAYYNMFVETNIQFL